MTIVEVCDDSQKSYIARHILEALSDWFAIPETREEYILNSTGKNFFCAFIDEKPAGFLYLKQTGMDTVELAVMGVLREYHRLGIGSALFDRAKQAVSDRYSFIQVKTVQMGLYDDFDRTNLFYQSLGFKEFEVFPTLWDENNPCQVYVMAL